MSTARQTAAEDRACFARLADGEPDAFSTLFHRYYEALCAFAEAIVGSADEAEEVVAEVFVRIWERRDRLVVRESVRSYLYSATRNRALNHLRDRGTESRWLKRASAGGEMPGLARPAAGVLPRLYAADLNEAIDRAIAELPARPREVFLLHRRSGMTYAEIADALDLSPKTVENHIGRALKGIRTHLAPFLEADDA